MNCRRSVPSINGSRWIRMAERMARSIKARTGVKRRIIEGCIVEGKRNGDNLSASVIEPQTLLIVFGPGPVAPTGDLEQGRFQFSPITTAFNRDNLHWDWANTPPPTPNAPCTQIYVFTRAQLLERNEAQAQSTPPLNAFDHGVQEYADGRRTAGQGRALGATVGSQDLLLFYRTAQYPTFYVFSFSVYRGYPNAGFVDGQLQSVPRPTFGFTVDSDWLETHTGGQVVQDWPDPAQPVPSDRWSQDSAGGRFQAPWCYASLVSNDNGSAVWQVATRITSAPAGTKDYWGGRKLATFRVQVGIDQSVSALPVSLYDPADSADLLRVPQSRSAPDVYYRNSFCAPATGPKGAMVIGQVVRQLDELDNEVDYFHSVLLTPGGNFIELELASDVERSKVWFVGGDEVDSVIWMLNPFMDGGLVAVNADTGQINIITRPAWRAPLATDLTGKWSEDHMRNSVTHIGNGKLVFPVADATGLAVSMGQYNVRTGLATQVGSMWAASLIDQRGGVSKIGVVQMETEDRPAVLLAGFSNGGAGASFISYDSGLTWAQISSIYGPNRAIGVVGNGLYYPKPGRMWRNNNAD